jgi:hypothetical protein
VTDLHRFKIAAGPEGWATTVEMDGRPLVCSKITIEGDASKPVKVTIELPAYVEFEGVAEASFVRPVLVRPAETPAAAREVSKA